MDKKSERGLYEAPEVELIEMVESWGILQNLSDPLADDGTGNEEEDQY